MSQTITPQELRQLKASNPHLEVIDVRTPVEYQDVHLEYARNIPLDRLDPRALIAAQAAHAPNPIYVICKSGSRGKMACDKIRAAGFDQVINIEGGTEACVSAGLPVKRGKRAMSLERQVRIAAGTLVLTGAVLGLTVHPYWIGLSAFVGAGLIFAGITDTCGMGMMLARMPWNQTGGSSCSIK